MGVPEAVPLLTYSAEPLHWHRSLADGHGVATRRGSEPGVALGEARTGSGCEIRLPDGAIRQGENHKSRNVPLSERVVAVLEKWGRTATLQLLYCNTPVRIEPQDELDTPKGKTFYAV